MRTLTSTLLSAQQSKGAKPLVKLVLSKTGETTETFYFDYTNDRTIKSYKRTEVSELSYKLTILLENKSNDFCSKDYRGYTATLSRGFVTTAGDEYDACPPLKVMYSQLVSTPATRLLYLVCAGAPDLMSGEYASMNYNPYYGGSTTTSGGTGSTTFEIPEEWGIVGDISAGGATQFWIAYGPGLDVETATISAGVKFKVNNTGTLYTLGSALNVNGFNLFQSWSTGLNYAGVDPDEIIIPSANNLNGCCYQRILPATGLSYVGTYEPDWPIPDWTSTPPAYNPTIVDGEITWQAVGARTLVFSFTPALEAFTPNPAGDIIHFYSASYEE